VFLDFGDTLQYESNIQTKKKRRAKRKEKFARLRLLEPE
jgi:hypothetical protein